MLIEPDPAEKWIFLLIVVVITVILFLLATPTPAW